jgi:hypothetical protein
MTGEVRAFSPQPLTDEERAAALNGVGEIGAVATVYLNLIAAHRVHGEKTGARRAVHRGRTLRQTTDRAGTQFPRRIHQEDVCQALGLIPTSKYQEDGGLGISQITTLIRRVSANPETDVERFLKANMFNWLIGGTDAHAKNYSFLIDAGDEIRLAPPYDLSSQLPYPDLIAQRVAMKIGDHYDIARVTPTDWQNRPNDRLTRCLCYPAFCTGTQPAAGLR